MSWKYLVLALLAWQVQAASSLNLNTHVFSIEAPSKGEKDFSLLSVVDGRVYKVDATNEVAISAAKLAASARNRVVIELEASDSDYVRNVNILPKTIAEMAEEVSRDNSRATTFRPSVVETRRDANRLFKSVFSFENADLEDNCFNRAHFWARTYELNENLKTQKVFIMFTSKYRREHNYKWWYHVAPFILVGSSKEEIVLDPSFEDKPLTMAQWAADFAEKARNGCEDVDTLNDYYDRGEKDDCHLIRASMYHYTPNDLYKIPSKSEWQCSDLTGPTRALPAPGKPWKEVLEDGFLPEDCR